MGKFTAVRTGMAFAILVLGFSFQGNAARPASIHAAASASCPIPVPGRAFSDDTLEIDMGLPNNFDPINVICAFLAKVDSSTTANNGNRKVKGNGRIQTFNPAGFPTGSFDWKIKTDRAGYDSFNLPANVLDNLGRLTVDVNVTGRKTLNQANVRCTASNAPPCMENDTTLCLLDERFQVEVDWQSSSLGSGQGMVLKRGNKEGSFYFINPNSQDLLVQLLNACSNNDHFWVFASATTSVEYNLTVTDTWSGEVRTYDNDLGRPAEPILDTAAFATCP